jgi:hypothetical protein
MGLALIICGAGAGQAEAKAPPPSKDFDDLMGEGAAPVADKELGEQRGGFIDVNGVLVRFGVDITRTVNGEVTRSLHAVFDTPVPVFHNAPAVKVATTPTSNPISTLIGAGVTAAATIVTSGDTGGTPLAPAAVVLPPATTPTAQDLAAVTEALQGPVVVVNDLSNVVIQQTTQVTIDIANYSGFARQAAQSQIGAAALDLVRAQLLGSLAKF